MKKQVFGAIASAATLGAGLLSAPGVFAEAPTPFCVDNGNAKDACFATLQEAFDQAPTNNIPTNIYLDGDATLVEDGGVVAKEGQNITLDLKGKTYKVTSLVGSTGTVTNGFQFLKNSTIEIKNGTIISDIAKHYIQNYADLTLNDVVLNAKDSTVTNYVLSNCNGDINILGSSSIYAPEGKVAFDVYYWPDGGYSDGINMTVNTTGTISGTIEYGGDKTDKEHIAEKLQLNIVSGTFDGKIVVDESALGEDKATGITITGGNFANEPADEDIPEGYAKHYNETTKTWFVTKTIAPTPEPTPEEPVAEKEESVPAAPEAGFMTKETSTSAGLGLSSLTAIAAFAALAYVQKMAKRQ